MMTAPDGRLLAKECGRRISLGSFIGAVFTAAADAVTSYMINRPTATIALMPDGAFVLVGAVIGAVLGFYSFVRMLMTSSR